MIASTVGRRTPAFRASVALVVAGFAMLTALALLQIGIAATALRPRAPTAASNAASATRSAVDRFYAAIDVVLATGDAAPLEIAVDPAFVDHGAAGQTSDRVGLIADLLARRQTDPNLQFDVAAVIVDGDQALAYLQTDPFHETDARPITTIDALRVRGGVVVERWSDGRETATAVPTPESDRSASGPVPTPAPAERGRGDGVRLAPFAPTAIATPLTPRRFPRTQK